MRGRLTQGALVSMSMQVVRLDLERREEEKSPGSFLGVTKPAPASASRLAREAGSPSQSAYQQLDWPDRPPGASFLGRRGRLGLGLCERLEARGKPLLSGPFFLCRPPCPSTVWASRLLHSTGRATSARRRQSFVALDSLHRWLLQWLVPGGGLQKTGQTKRKLNCQGAGGGAGSVSQSVGSPARCCHSWGFNKGPRQQAPGRRRTPSSDDLAGTPYRGCG